MNLNDKQQKLNGIVTNEKPISLPSDFKKTLKDLLNTKPDPKENKPKPTEKKRPSVG